MRKSVRTLAVFFVASAFAVAACADVSPTEPESPAMQQASAEQSNLLGGLLGGLIGGVVKILFGLVNGLIAPVTRSLALDQDVSWSFVAGPGGAVSSNSSVGLTVTVPSGALASTQVIKVTALAGDAVAYRFEPHGLVFQRPVTLKQSLNGVSFSSRDVLVGAYFKTDRLVVNENGLAQISEVLPVALNPYSRTATFQIEHFSGYILASGRSLEENEEGYEGR
jgi:hypothetical protein